MASFLDKFKIKTAMEKNTPLDLSCQHITTANFMQLSPIYIKEMVPGESIDINMSTFTRLAPMAVPTLGRALIHNRAFFVPMRTIFSRWDEFITRSPGNSVTQSGGNNTSYLLNKVPYINNTAIVNYFLGATSNNPANFAYASSGGLCLNPLTAPITDADKAAADICVKVVTKNGTTDSVTFYYYNFTDYGRSVYKVLQSLGYNIVWTTYLYDTYTNSTDINTDMRNDVPQYEVSLLPLLSFVKLYIDWYWPAQYVGNSQYNVLKSICDFTPNTNTQTAWSSANLKNLFDNLCYAGAGVIANYDSSYLVSAFDNPEGPNINSTGSFIIGNIDLDNPEEQVITNTNIGYSDVQNGTARLDMTNAEVLTQYGLHALHALTDYLKRHQLVGVRALDRFYARFGISLSSEALKRSNYIGSMNVPLQFGDVMSHTDTPAGTPLGGYAGKGLGYGENSFSFKSDDYGYIVICSSIIPQVGYYQGLDRMNMHISPLDFYTPEFDQLGNQAISRLEVLCPENYVNAASVATDEQNIDAMNKANLAEGIFGWTPRYSEYKIGRDKVTGDYRVRSKSAVGDTDDAWHLMRNLDEQYQNSSDIVHDFYFVRGHDYKQYNRIFFNTDDTADKFYLIHNFQITSNSPMHSLYDTYEFENKGKEVVADVNGVKVN